MNKNHFPIHVWVRVVSLLKDNSSVADVAYKLKVTYSHVHGLLLEAEKKGLVNREKEGRKRLCSLTKKGVELSKHCEEILKILEVEKNE